MKPEKFKSRFDYIHNAYGAIERFVLGSCQSVALHAKIVPDCIKINGQTHFHFVVRYYLTNMDLNLM
jgi:hypothetical protein